MNCQIINVETGKECGPNEPGEVYVKGPTLMLGYFKNPKATADAIDKEGWLRTGFLHFLCT